MYIVAPITVFDEDKELWETYVGVENSMALCFSSWGKTEEISRARAVNLADIFNQMWE